MRPPRPRTARPPEQSTTDALIETNVVVSSPSPMTPKVTVSAWARGTWSASEHGVLGVRRVVPLRQQTERRHARRAA
jgi:hypothetical protein